MRVQKRIFLIAIFALMIVVSACSGSGDADTATTPSPAMPAETPGQPIKEPFTLRVIVSGTVNPETFDKQFKTPEFLEKYPNVKLEYESIAKLEEYVAAGQIPDLINVVPGNMARVQALGLAFDMTSLAKKNNLDLEGFDKTALEAIRTIGGKEGLIAVPDKPPGFPYLATYGIAYNKDIFDKFAIPYPKDNMTWNQIIELSKQFVRIEGGIQYYGLAIVNATNIMMDQRGLSFLNKDGKVDLSDKKWTEIFQLLKNASDAQGNWSGAINGNFNQFQKDHNTAMILGPLAGIVRTAETLEGQLNWDMVSVPRFEDQKEAVVPYSSGVFMVSSQSKFKDAAFDLITMSIYAKDTNKQAIENPAALKRNMGAIRGRPIGLAPINKYSGDFSAAFKQAALDIVTKNIDINTALRQAQEETQKKM